MSYSITERELGRLRESLDLEGKRILLYHNDPDGICSAALLLRFFPGFETIPRAGPWTSSEFIGELISKKPRLVAFIDIPIDQEEKKIRRLQKRTGCRVVIIDHHIYEKNMDSREILHINPRFRDRKAYIPCSTMIYRMLERMGFDVRRFCWIAATGIIGDYAFEDSADILDECRDEYPYLLKEHPLDSKLREGADMISYSTIMKGLKGAVESLKVLLKSLDYEEFARDKKLLKWWKEMKREFEFIVKDAEREEHPDIGLVIYSIKTRFNVTSLVATYFSENDRDKIIAVRKRLKNRWKVCLRNQSGRINLGNIAKKCVSGIGSGGGHEKAAGILTTDWEMFKKRLIASLKGKAR